MTAKHKLNTFHFRQAVVVAAITGFVFQSLNVFLTALCVILLSAYQDGDIRR